MNLDFKKLAPYITALIVFILLPFIFADALFDGKELRQGDIIKYEGMSKEIQEHRERQSEEPLWTGRAFSGMPAFTISVYYPNNLIFDIQQFLTTIFPAPVNFLFLLCLGFYILLLAFKVDPWISIIGAIAFAFSSNFITSIEAGHNTKVLSIAYMPAIIGGIIWTFNRKYWIGGTITALFVGLQISAAHFQIIYYTFLVALIIGIVYLIKAIQTKEFKPFLLASGILVGAALVGVLPNFNLLYNTYVHTKETMRGEGSALKAETEGSGGLDISYALDDWSYGVGETGTLMFPDFSGGSSGEELAPGSPVHKAIETHIGREIPDPLQAPTYYGPQRFTAPIYIGASVIFLFIFGLFILKGRDRWWIISAAVLSLFIAWGSHFKIFNEFLFYNFPMFNKFRNPAMALCIIGMAVPLLGFLALNKASLANKLKGEYLKPFRFSLFAVGAIFAVAALYGFSSDFKAVQETQADSFLNNVANQVFGGSQAPEAQVAIFKNDLYKGIVEARENLFWKSFLRSLIIVGLVAGLLFFFLKGKVNKWLVIGGIAVIIIYDHWTIDKRYLSDQHFVESTNLTDAFRMTPADQRILQDPDPSYRVLNLTGGVFSDGITPYYHKSVLGYSAAKIQVYQDLIENQLGNEVQQVYSIFSSVRDPNQLSQAVRQQLPVLNMLNTRYIILGPEANGVYQNPNALGNAWFISNVQFTSSAQETMKALATLDPAATALVPDNYKDQIRQSYTVSPDAQIRLIEYKPNHLTYQSKNTSEGLGIFSEVYYETGWNAYIDGQRTPIYKVNYALRGVKIPAGEQKIEMKFEPDSYITGNKVSLAGSILFVLFVAGLLGYRFYARKKGKSIPSNTVQY